MALLTCVLQRLELLILRCVGGFVLALLRSLCASHPRWSLVPGAIACSGALASALPVFRLRCWAAREAIEVPRSSLARLQWDPIT